MVTRGSSWKRLTITVRQVGDVSILDLSGPLGIGEPREIFRNQIDDLLTAGTKQFAINMTNVPFVDSTGIGALVGAHTTIEAAGGSCRIFGVQPQVFNVLKIVHVDQVLSLTATEEAALSGFQ